MMADVVHVRDVKHYKHRLPTLIRDFKDLYRFEERNVQWLADRVLGTNEEPRYVCRVKLENVPKIIVTCVVLHNIAKTFGDPDFKPAEEAPEENHQEENHHFDNSFRHQEQEIK
ncbi:hypothetical protein AVEN_137795-1 [Araneus ventricosus]|uniref:DDE Tnp4 domain-containing protein n=1 Tax=Araneus ventricosus TaxID=182803 RepID=A0A4Y2SYF6_ARAVE|nr:hypothetical protein AVEN_137795-1 [Araneus ventricosus]